MASDLGRSTTLDRTTIVARDELVRIPSDEAVAIGEWLATNPPPGYRDRYSAVGWAIVAHAVLTARDALKPGPSTYTAGHGREADR